MISRGIRLIFSALILFASIMIGLTGFAQPAKASEGAGYADNRDQADRHFLTVRARRYFNDRTPILFAHSLREAGLSNIKLQLDSRLIAQFGRGAASANKILPEELERILKFISEARFKRADTLKQMIALKSMSQFKRAEIERALEVLGHTRIIRLDSAGYFSKKHRQPKFSMKSRKLIHFAKWNERDSRYEAYSDTELKNIIIRGIIAEISR